MTATTNSPHSPMTKEGRKEHVFGVTMPMFIGAVGYWGFGVPGLVAGLLFVIIITVIS